MAIRAPFLYAGYKCWNKNGDMKEYSYTDAQLQGLGGATEFVVTACNFQNYFDATGAPDSYYLQVYVDRAVKLANRLYNMYGKKVWIGTPQVGLEAVVPHTTTVYAEVARRMTYFVDNVMAAFGGEATFKSRVKGFYMNAEGIYGTFSSISTHPQVSMFQTVSNYVARFGMQMMWSPCWDTINLENAARIIHRTNIFDYVLVQPNYYFGEINYKENCEAIRAAIQTQKLCYQNKLQIIPNAQITCHRAKSAARWRSTVTVWRRLPVCVTSTTSMSSVRPPAATPKPTPISVSISAVRKAPVMLAIMPRRRKSLPSLPNPSRKLPKSGLPSKGVRSFAHPLTYLTGIILRTTLKK